MLHLAILTPLFLGSPSPAPLPPFQEAERRSQEPITAVEYFRPQRAPAYELMVTLQELYSGGSGVGVTFGDVEPSPSFLTFGESLLIRYRDDRIGQVLKLAERLDAEWAGSAPAQANLESLEYRASYLTLDSIANALQPFRHPLTLRDAQRNTYQTNNLSFLEERGLVIVRGPRDELDEIRSVLARIDVPQPQVLVTCYLIEGVEEVPETSKLPGELTDNLAQLVPFGGFQLMSMGILRSDALARMQMEVDMGPTGRFKLMLSPKAFEPSQRTLTLQGCQFELNRLIENDWYERSFTTSARIQAGEYTVLGAVGSEPIFVVLYMALIEG